LTAVLVSGSIRVVIENRKIASLTPVLVSLFLGEAVNVTLGLPFIRTSIDRGTAFDIAGKGLVEYSSMLVAITLARNSHR